MRRVEKATRLLRDAMARDPVTRFAGRHLLAAEIANLLGHFRIYNADLYWPDDAEFFDVWKGFPEADGRIKDRRFALWSLARSVAGLEGDTAECGVFNGASSWLMCAAITAPDSRHHMFDSFEGLSEPMGEDRPADDHTFRWKKHDLAVGLNRVERNMAAFGDRVRLHPGWIPERFPVVADRTFSFVHVDVDLYQPTRDSIEWFYPRLCDGGILLCDDYGFTSCPGARRAFDEFVADKPESSVIHLPTGQGFIVKR